MQSNSTRWSPYWLNPITLSILVVASGVLMFALIPETTFLRQFKQDKADVAFVSFIHMFSLAIFIAGCSVAILVCKGPDFSGNNYEEFAHRVVRSVGYSSLYLSLFGYFVYFGLSKASPDLYLSAIAGSKGAIFALKRSFEKLPGITSFMNLACWWYLYIAHEYFIRGRKLSKSFIFCTTILSLMCLVRAFAVNERRVIFEIALPAAMYVVMYKGNWTSKARGILNAAPAYGVLAVIVVFLITEYFRSWTNFYSDGRAGVGYFEFALSRLGGYYVTAMNNGCDLFQAEIRTNGYLTFGGLMKMPIISDIAGMGDYRREMLTQYTNALFTLANPELNNPGGIISPVVDFGYVIGCFIIFITGIMFGAMYSFASRGGIFGILFYSVAFFGILEFTRLWYIGSANAVINFLFLVVVYLVFNVQGQRRAISPMRR